jgi:suppressor of G2 allele of SKP1
MASSAPDSALASEAMEAFVDDDFASAFELYTKLVDAAPTRASAWIHRSATLLKLDRPAEALEDAERAVALDPDNAKAHLRRGMALHALDRPADARTAFERGRALDPMSKQLLSWIAKCDDALDARVAPSSSASGASSAPAPPLPAAPAYKHQWYQSQTHVTIEVLAKGVDPEAVEFDLRPDAIRVTVRAYSASSSPSDPPPYELSLRLFGDVAPERSECKVTPAKLEMRLEKAEAIQWTDLTREAREAGGENARPTQPNNFSDPSRFASGGAPRAYPSSFSASARQRAPTDWDALEAELKAEEAEEKPEGDAALNKLFQDIYGKADDDTRRAMNKSFQESGGTVLSTNWGEIGAKKTEVQPPTGMEAREYEQ